MCFPVKTFKKLGVLKGKSVSEVVMHFKGWLEMKANN